MFVLPSETPVRTTVAVLPETEILVTLTLPVFADVTSKVSLYPDGDIVRVTVVVALVPTLIVDTLALFCLAVTPVIAVTAPSAYVKYVL